MVARRVAIGLAPHADAEGRVGGRRKLRADCGLLFHGRGRLGLKARDVEDLLCRLAQPPVVVRRGTLVDAHVVDLPVAPRTAEGGWVERHLFMDAFGLVAILVEDDAQRRTEVALVEEDARIAVAGNWVVLPVGEAPRSELVRRVEVAGAKGCALKDAASARHWQSRIHVVCIDVAASIIRVFDRSVERVVQVRHVQPTHFNVAGGLSEQRARSRHFDVNVIGVCIVFPLPQSKKIVRSEQGVPLVPVPIDHVRLCNLCGRRGELVGKLGACHEDFAALDNLGRRRHVFALGRVGVCVKVEADLVVRDAVERGGLRECGGVARGCSADPAKLEDVAVGRVHIGVAKQGCAIVEHLEREPRAVVAAVGVEQADLHLKSRIVHPADEVLLARKCVCRKLKGQVEGLVAGRYANVRHGTQ